ncbi:hypothetical protein WN944_016377 [Citrus x changshan-huyou]|uniref:Uncharacterized protein n=1 Tax=Citrus x changshan-huyou TaxID=2935761 RepID=A0AAP0MDL5_9ROSI
MKCDCQLEQFLLRNSFKHIARMRSPHIRPSKMLVSLFRNRTQCLVPSFKTMTTVAAAKTSKDDYFVDVNHIANIVRHDIYPERTLNRLNLTLISELVCSATAALLLLPNPSASYRGPAPGPILPHLP